jgi:hypothetical protein
MGAYRGHAPNFLGMVRRVPPVSAYKLGLSLGEDPRRNAKALKCVFSASEGILYACFSHYISGPKPFRHQNKTVDALD